MKLQHPRWSKAGSTPELRRDRIDIWSVHWRLLSDNVLDRWYPKLSPEERRRADAFEFPVDRSRYVATHAFARRLLAAETGYQVAELTFKVGPFGKPKLEAPAGKCEAVQFNLSRSKDLIVGAFSRGRPVGIDVESTDQFEIQPDVAETVFTAREMDYLGRPETREKKQWKGVFLQLWTCKEAVQKATGEGMSRPPRSLELEIEDGEVRGLRCLDPMDNELPAPDCSEIEVTCFEVDGAGIGAVAWIQKTTGQPELRYRDGTDLLDI